MAGQKIKIPDGVLQVPDLQIIPFIEGDGTGSDIWASSVKVFNAAVEKAYNGHRRIHWKEVFAGEKSYNPSGKWLPKATLDTIKVIPGGHQGAPNNVRGGYQVAECGTEIINNM